MYFRPHMPISKERLETALSLIKRDLIEGGDQWRWYTTGTFVIFSSDVSDPSLDSSKVIDDTLKRKYANMHRHLRRIEDDLDILLTMLHQANWQKTMVRQGHLDTYHNMLYGGVLADAFLTRYRSTYDTIAKAFKEIARHPAYAPDTFSLVRKECRKPNNVKIYGDDLAHLIESSDWFDQTKKVRNGIVYDNFQTSGFMHSRILFQVSKRHKTKGFVNMINFPEVMINETLVDFELYAAVHIAYTLWLLEEFAKLGYDILQPVQFPNSKETKSGSVGLDVLKDSIERVLAAPTQAK
jgi:hypothetical protein